MHKKIVGWQRIAAPVLATERACLPLRGGKLTMVDLRVNDRHQPDGPLLQKSSRFGSLVCFMCMSA